MDIQGLRAIAVLAVVIYHAGVPGFSGGYIGVDIFFVISGYLITSHLLRGLGGDGRIHLASFYAKRARRILPASLLVVALTVVAALIWYPPLLMKSVLQGAVATALYVPNYLFAWQRTDYLAETIPSLFQHYWSLGIEEQFYLLWPLLLAAGFALFKTRRSLFLGVGIIVLLSFVACVVVTASDQPWAFFGLPTRAWELGVGGLAAFLVAHRPVPMPGAVGSVAGWIGLVGVLACVVLFSDATPFPGYWAAVPVFCTALVIVAGESPSRFGPGRVLSLRGMTFIGAISYSLYLVHWPILEIPKGAIGFEQPLPLWTTVALAAASVPVAWVLYTWVENPARNSAFLVDARPRRSLVTAAAGSLAVVLISVGAYGVSSLQPTSSARVAGTATFDGPPEATPFVPADLTTPLADAERDQSEAYADGCHLSTTETTPKGCVYGDEAAPRIVLFGDSHATQWLPALQRIAAQQGYSVELQTKGACPSVEVHIIRNEQPYESCDKWREAVLGAMSVETPPALVVLANYGNVDYEFEGDKTAAWGDGLRSTLSHISAPTVIIADSPYMSVTPAFCLSQRLNSADTCGRPFSEAVPTSLHEEERSVADDMGAETVDLTSKLCTEWCPPIIGNTLIYRDEHHITASASEALAEALWGELTSAGLLPSNGQ
ncbi:acyltransferase family protein [Microbacterium thalli]|uniref:acyltransferase family protein n=1 Tax=Microbacterium thalli TaxID=3027921 RepID=UPI002365C96C|nr:acyltransferase family protein [Microbacterium thalli]MDD7930055.1 acyltransferase family protein [Microbacterium thalli]